MINIVKYTDISTAISRKIIAKFPTIKLMSESDVSEKIIRPSFFISLDNLKANKFCDSALDKNITIRIYYYPTDAKKNKIENLNIIDELNEIFVENNIIKVNENFNIEIFDEVEADVIDKIVHYYFNVFTSEEIITNEDDIEMMEELEINIKQ
ncbi:phage tail terminator family protein [Clostridium tagluense]|uniref:phage tail terminator family protein n=1 Tax=Clostridium tagluense TaxID=360422 RepID=UPI001C6F45D2|nr:hypothetical protein [Clostridium tagluense]MBW9154862.1 hypothetical protein [Clostridium tagluense]WLC64317.1 hypothetical protein KTC93_15760 [Clostridium tagluense]